MTTPKHAREPTEQEVEAVADKIAHEIFDACLLELSENGSPKRSQIMKAARAAISAMPSGWRPTHAHPSGNFFKLLGSARYSAEAQEFAVYQTRDGMMWLLPWEHFNARFTAFPSPQEQKP